MGKAYVKRQSRTFSFDEDFNNEKKVLKAFDSLRAKLINNAKAVIPEAGEIAYSEAVAALNELPWLQSSVASYQDGGAAVVEATHPALAGINASPNGSASHFMYDAIDSAKQHITAKMARSMR